MTVSTIVSGSVQRQMEIASATQSSVNAETVVDGSEIDARAWDAVTYSVVVATKTITLNVYGALDASYSDERQLQTGDVAAAAVGYYTTTPPLYSYYRLKILSKVEGQHGDATVRGLAK